MSKNAVRIAFRDIEIWLNNRKLFIFLSTNLRLTLMIHIEYHEEFWNGSEKYSIYKINMVVFIVNSRAVKFPNTRTQNLSSHMTWLNNFLNVPNTATRWAFILFYADFSTKSWPWWRLTTQKQKQYTSVSKHRLLRSPSSRLATIFLILLIASRMFNTCIQIDCSLKPFH